MCTNNATFIQSDCKQVIATMLQGAGSVTAACAIYQDIAIQACTFDYIVYAFCPRDSNVLAHTLAEYADDQPSVWDSNVVAHTSDC